MEHINVQDLLEKQRTGKITQAERDLLETWYTQWQPEELELSAEEFETLKAQVWRAVNPHRKNTFKITTWYSIAAAVVFIVVSSSAYYLLNKTEPQPVIKQVAVKAPVYDFKPGTNKALLTLSGGQQIVLNDAKNGQLTAQGTVVVSKAGTGQIKYGKNGLNGSADATASMFNTLSTPRGGQYHVTLSDGTEAWLNAASSITYPVTFNANERHVKVVGEVYFEVAHNAHSPFTVSTANQEVTVLGTHFNLKAYPDDPATSTTLLAGSVKIKNMSSGESQMLKPGQQAKLKNNQDPIVIKNVNADDAISWKNGYFLFDNQDINSVMRIMSRWYDVDIAYNNYRRNDRFGGTFSRTSNMSEILHNFEQVSHLRFKIEAKKIIVTD